MKKQLLLFVLPMVLFTATLQAQDKVWDFGTDDTTWPLGGGVSVPTLIDNLALIPGEDVTNLGQVDSNSKTWEDGYSSTNRFKLNGSGGADPLLDAKFVPEKRYLKFAVAGNCTIDIWYRKSGGSDRTLYITDGSAIVASVTPEVDDSDPYILEASYTGGAANLYIFGGKNSFNLYKIEVTGALGSTTLGVGNKTIVSAEIKAIDGRVYVSNVKTSTDIRIYSITGALVKGLKTKEDINFSFNAGIYIATVKTSEGQKSFKFVVR